MRRSKARGPRTEQDAETGKWMSTILEKISSPADVKKLSMVELERLAEEIRERLIIGVSKTGGHIGPNLGVVELTLALHYVFYTPTTNFFFHVSHQPHVHNLLPA